MRILVGNDDGVDSKGLAALAEAARRLTTDVTVVAPARKWTAASHQLTFDMDLSLEARGEGVYACSGAPADCLIAAVTVLMSDSPPDLVLSGVNHGRNTGPDAVYSGTLAYAREAALRGIPAVAFSRVREAAWAGGDVAHLAALVEKAWASRASWARGQILSFNLPLSLPAGLAAAAPARDRIAGAVDILDRTAGGARFRWVRGRTGPTTADDQNALIDRGRIVVDAYAMLPNRALSEADLTDWGLF